MEVNIKVEMVKCYDCFHVMYAGFGVLDTSFHGVGSGSAFIRMDCSAGTENNVTGCALNISTVMACNDAAVICRGKFYVHGRNLISMKRAKYPYSIAPNLHVEVHTQDQCSISCVSTSACFKMLQGGW